MPTSLQNDQNDTSRLDEALSYLEHEWAVLPLRASSKEPNTRVLKAVYGSSSWSPLAKRPASVPEVRAWFECDPHTGIGIITGQVSEIAIRDWDCGRPERLPATPIVQASRGVHVYLGSSGPVKTVKLPDGELRGDGGYVCAPPSIHPSGIPYRWIVDPSIPLAPLALSDPLLGLFLEPSPRLPEPRPIYASVPEEERGGVEPSLSELESWARDSAWVARAAQVLGIAEPLGRSFCCVLPGREERNPSANLWPGPEGWLYRCMHYREGPRGLLIPDVYATLVSGRWRKRNKGELARWMRRLLAATGDVKRHRKLSVDRHRIMSVAGAV